MPIDTADNIDAELDLSPHRTARAPELLEEARRQLIACGPVVVAADNLTNPRAYKHRPHPLDPHFDALVAAVGEIDDWWRLRDAVWRHLVATEVVAVLELDVVLAAGSYNSAYARYVDGLTENGDALRFADRTLTAEVVADRVLAAVAGALTAPEVSISTRPSVAEAGIGALVGRRVEVSFLGATEGIVGRLVGCPAGALVVDCGEASLVVVPLHAVAYVSTYQRTAVEDEYLD